MALVAFYYLSLLSLGLCASMAGKARRQVLMISFDGFRWDYIGRYPTPNFDEFRKDGVWVKNGVTAAFFTKTLPDHYTMATGLYSESHGVVANEMYDPLFKESFTVEVNDSKWWDGGEPIWITAKLRGLSSASYFWAGSNVVLKNTKADFCPPYDQSVPFNERVENIVGWLEDKVDVVLGYFHEPDYTGHRQGTMSPAVGEAIKRVDDALGYLIEKLKGVGLYDSIDILLVSDHGMTNLSRDGIIYLRDYLDLDQDVERIVQEGPLASIMPKAGRKDAVYNKLLGIKNTTVYKKEDIPKRFHYTNHRRIMDIEMFADEGFYILEKPLAQNETLIVANHGYDNQLSSMKPIFMARGPDFKKNYISEGFETVNIYPLLCHLLGIEPAPNNGSLDNVKHMLLNSPSAANPLRSERIYLPGLFLLLLLRIAM